MEFRNKVRTTMELVFNSTSISIFYVNRKGQVLFQCKTVFTPNLPSELVHHLLQIKHVRPINLVYFNEKKEKVIFIPVEEPSGESFLLVLWPNVITKSTPNLVHEGRNKPLNIVDNLTLFHTSNLLFYLLFNESLDITEITEGTQELVLPIIQKDQLELELIAMRENRNFHKSYLAEIELFQCVTEGNPTKLKQQFEVFLSKGVYGNLSKNNLLRHSKNLIIAAITLATRAALKGGMYHESAYLLSDMYIQSIEELEVIDNMEILLEKILVDFAEQVRIIQRKNLSKTVYLCQEYIINHLYEPISLSDLGEIVNLSPNYLSAKFKQETGKNISEYICKLRIEEAHKLILHSGLNMTEIYTLLNFNDQSQFIKMFKRYTDGLTPLQFKNKHIYD